MIERDKIFIGGEWRPSSGDGVMPDRDASGETYEVYALRYAARGGTKATEYYGFERYGEPSAPCPLNYYFWLARSDDRTILVDCGYSTERAREQGRYEHNDPNNDPLDVLGLLGVKPADVDHVVISHMHYDPRGEPPSVPQCDVQHGAGGV